VRRRWVCEQLRARQQLRREDLELQFGVSARTAKRDFQALRDVGEVEFVGPAKTGHYRLASQRR
jgi:DeoR/GlpR family transcriptional regulator of sugar metabolism